MSQRAVEGLLGRLITDGDFRHRFYQEPAATCTQEAIDVIPRELSAVLAVEERAIEKFARLLDPKIVRAVVRGTSASARQHAARGKLSPAKASGQK